MSKRLRRFDKKPKEAKTEKSFNVKEAVRNLVRDFNENYFYDYSHCQHSSEAIMSSFDINGLGSIPIPISVGDIQRIKAIASKAPYGVRDQTLYNSAVRDSWELDASLLSASCLESLTEMATKRVRSTLRSKMDISAEAMGVRAHPYKLLLYEAGGHFSKHRDSEKAENMFASYLLQVPVEGGHEGGELQIYAPVADGYCVKPQNAMKTLNTSKCGKKGEWCEALFYADCLHELKEVTSGYRVVLAFNLTWRLPNNENIFLLKSQLPLSTISYYCGLLERILANWEQQGVKQQGMLYFRLSHKYTQKHLSFKGLKGNDAQLAQLFLLMKARLNVYLVHISQYVSGFGSECGDVNVTKEEFKYTWVDPKDEKFPGYELNEESDLVTYDEEDDRSYEISQVFDEREDLDTKKAEATGNSGVEFKRWYSTSALVISPSIFKDYLNFIHFPHEYVDELCSNLTWNPEAKVFELANTAKARKLLNRLDNVIFESNPSKLLQKIAVAQLLGKYTVVDNLLEQNEKRFGLVIDERILEHLRKTNLWPRICTKLHQLALCKYECSWLIPYIEFLVSSCGQEELDSFYIFAKKRILSSKELRTHPLILSHLFANGRKEILEEFEKELKRIAVKLFPEIESVNEVQLLLTQNSAQLFKQSNELGKDILRTCYKCRVEALKNALNPPKSLFYSDETSHLSFSLDKCKLLSEFLTSNTDEIITLDNFKSSSDARKLQKDIEDIYPTLQTSLTGNFPDAVSLTVKKTQPYIDRDLFELLPLLAQDLEALEAVKTVYSYEFSDEHK